MIEHIWLYSSLSGVVTLLCAFLSYRALSAAAPSPYVKLFANLSIMNLLQTVAYIMFAYSPSLAEYGADAYLIALYFLFAHLPMLSLCLSQKDHSKLFKYLYIVPALLAIFHLSGFMIESYRVENNSLMHNDAELAWTFDLFIILSSVATVVVFITNARQTKDDYLLASRNIIAALSFIPLVIAFSTLILLSRTDYAIPVVVVIPLISTYITLVFNYVRSTNIIDLSIGPAAIVERFKVAYLALTVLQTRQDVDQIADKLRHQKYIEALRRHQNDYKAAAKELNIHPSTLYSRINKT